MRILTDQLRQSREQPANEIAEFMKDKFLRYGVELQAVRIGGVEKIRTPKALDHL